MPMINGAFVRPYKHTAKRDKEHFGKSEREVLGLSDLAHQVPKKVAEIHANEDLTPEGKRKAVRQLVQDLVLPQLKQAAATVRAAQDYAAQKRATLRPSGGDKTDVVGALIRKDIRDRFAAMDDAKRTALLTAPGLDPVTAAALAEAPAWLSGITPEQQQGLIERAMLASNPEIGAELVDLEDALETVGETVRAVTRTVAQHTDVRERELAERMGQPTLKEFIARLVGSDDDAAAA